MKAQLCHVSAIEIKAQIKINLWRQNMITLIKQKKKCKQNFRTLYRHDNFTWIFRCKITKIKKIGTCNDFW